MSIDKDSIQINDKSYRVEYNWEAVTSFLEAEDLPFGVLDEFAKLTPRQLTRLCYQGVVSGCKLDGFKFPYTFEAFMGAIRMPVIHDLILIYQYHATNTKGVKKKKIRKVGITKILHSLMFWK